MVSHVGEEGKPQESAGRRCGSPLRVISTPIEQGFSELCPQILADFQMAVRLPLAAFNAKQANQDASH